MRWFAGFALVLQNENLHEGEKKQCGAKACASYRCTELMRLPRRRITESHWNPVSDDTVPILERYVSPTWPLAHVDMRPWKKTLWILPTSLWILTNTGIPTTLYVVIRNPLCPAPSIFEEYTNGPMHLPPFSSFVFGFAST